jgi:gamma-glutamylcyclotransferase (GGCT)/AIG2-like uncharacterized protein YtfP
MDLRARWERLFVYGTLAPGRPNEHVLAEVPGEWEPAVVAGRLVDGGWGSALGYPAIVLDPEGPDRVDGVLFSSPELGEHWERLDDFEGEAYERVQTTASLSDGRVVTAHVYALRAQPTGR